MSDISDAVGHWVEVACGSISLPTVYSGGLHAFGILRDADEQFLYIEQSDGESICVPLDTVRDLRVVDEPERPNV